MGKAMISSVGGAAAGLAAQFQRFERSAARVARGGASGDYVGEAVEQMSVEHAVKANIAVIHAADDMVGTLIDIVA
jgi:hypothetical protein